MRILLPVVPYVPQLSASDVEATTSFDKLSNLVEDTMILAIMIPLRKNCATIEQNSALSW